MIVALGVTIFAAMIAEAVLSARHDRRLRARGAVEPRDDVMRAMQVAYPLGFVAILAEGAWRGVRPDAPLVAGSVVFLVAKLLKYWAIATLGERWTFRVLVPPASSRVTTGPYRWLRHPNYVAVVGEFVGAALAARALLLGPVVTLTFLVLIRRRVRVEERALGAPSAN